jgi:hypothetical protein
MYLLTDSPIGVRLGRLLDVGSRFQSALISGNIQVTLILLLRISGRLVTSDSCPAIF